MAKSWKRPRKDLAKRQDELTRGERNGKAKGPIVMGDEAVATPLDTDALISLSERERTIARPIVKEIQERLQFLVDVGLDYLSLDRACRDTIWRRGATYSFSDANW